MNKQLSCIIIDDEPIGREVVKTFVEKTPFLRLVAEFGDSLEALAFLQNNKVNIVFSDIEIPKLTGMDLIRSLPLPPVFIFITAHRDFALEGFETGATDFLTKPVRYERFAKAVNRAKDYLELTSANTSIPVTDKIFIKSEGKLVKILLGDIIFAEAQGDYLKIVTKTDTFTTLATLKSMDEILCPPKFFRIQRSFIINLSEVQAIVGNLVELTGSNSATVAVNKKEELLELLGVN